MGNEELSVLLSSDCEQSLMSPLKRKKEQILSYWQGQTSYSCLFLQTEYCGNYTLKDFIDSEDRMVDREQNMHIFSQILLGIATMHSKGIIHRDLKPENIFLDKKNKLVQIGDFGLSTSLNVDAMEMNHNLFGNNLTSNVGTFSYAAPEQLTSNTYGTGADIYSLGIILFELIQPAFVTMMERRIAINAFRNHHQIDEDRIDRQRFGKEMDLMFRMTDKRPLKRPSAHCLLFDSFIQIYWIKNVLNTAIPNEIERTMEGIEVKKEEKEKKSDSPTFLVSSPSLTLDTNHNHHNLVKVMSPLVINKMSL